MALENVVAEVESTSQGKKENLQFPGLKVIKEKIDALNEQIQLSEKAKNEATATRYTGGR